MKCPPPSPLPSAGMLGEGKRGKEKVRETLSTDDNDNDHFLVLGTKNVSAQTEGRI